MGCQHLAPQELCGWCIIFDLVDHKFHTLAVNALDVFY